MGARPPERKSRWPNEHVKFERHVDDGLHIRNHERNVYGRHHANIHKHVRH